MTLIFVTTKNLFLFFLPFSSPITKEATTTTVREREKKKKPRQLAHFNGNEAKKITRETHPQLDKKKRRQQKRATTQKDENERASERTEQTMTMTRYQHTPPLCRGYERKPRGWALSAHCAIYQITNYVHRRRREPTGDEWTQNKK